METETDIFSSNDPTPELGGRNMCSENEDGDDDLILNLEPTEPNTMDNKKKSSYKNKRIDFLFKRYLIYHL